MLIFEILWVYRNVKNGIFHNLCISRNGFLHGFFQFLPLFKKQVSSLLREEWKEKRSIKRDHILMAYKQNVGHFCGQGFKLQIVKIVYGKRYFSVSHVTFLVPVIFSTLDSA